MRLDLKGIADRKAWEDKGYRLPAFDIEEVRSATMEKPVWVHFGAGNIFRAFHAMLAQKLLDSGEMDRGITCVEGYDYEIIEKMNRPHDELSLMVTLRADGSTETPPEKKEGTVVASAPQENVSVKDVRAARKTISAAKRSTAQGQKETKGK